MYTLIDVSCTDQELVVTDAPPVIASGDVQTDKVRFEFCSKWDGMVKTAVFYRDGVNPINVLVDSDSECIIPQEVLKDEGTFWFGVMGVKDGKVKTSEVLKYKVKKGAVTTGTAVPDPTPDIYAQLITLIQEAGILFTRATQAEIEAILGDGAEGTGVITVSRLNQYHAGVKSWSNENHYKKSEVYSKEETYSKTESYKKSETDSKVNGIMAYNGSTSYEYGG